MAREYLNAEASISTLDCIRRGNGDIIRYDRVSQAFAVMRNDGIIKTFFRPDPWWHGFPSNLKYFQAECDK
jgi:pyocin large subunit-like protein